MTDGRLLLHETQFCFWQKIAIAKDCLLTDQEQACTKITRSVVWLSPCRKWPKYTEKWLLTVPLLSHPTMKLFSRPD